MCQVSYCRQNDHEQLRTDPLLALLSGRRELDEPLAGKSTLNRLELAGRSVRYHNGYSAASCSPLRKAPKILFCK